MAAPLITKVMIDVVYPSKDLYLLTFLILTFGIMMYLVMDGMMGGLEKDSIKNMIRIKTGDIKIYSKDYNEDDIYTIYDIKDYDKIFNILKNQPFVKGYTARINFIGMIELDYDFFPVNVMGIDFKNDLKVFDLLYDVKDIDLSKPVNEEIPIAFIGIDLADELGLDIGDYLLISLRTQKGMLNSIYLKIKGIIGGFHLVEANSDRIIKTVTALNEMKIEKLFAGHCTGFPAQVELFNIFKERFEPLHTGMVITV